MASKILLSSNRMGRATAAADQEIRSGVISRDEGIALVKRYDHEFPSLYYKWMLNYLEIDEELFWQVMNFYRENSNVWEKKYGEWTLKHVVS